MRLSQIRTRVGSTSLILHWSLIPALAFLAWILARGYFPMTNPYWTQGEYAVVGLSAAFLAYGAFLAHEIGHAIAAILNGVRVEKMSLFILGGSTQLQREAPTPAREFRIILAGPLVSIGLAALFQGIALLSQYGEPIYALSSYLAQANLLLAAFNILPVLPLDGGRLITTALWAKGFNKDSAELYTNLASLGLGVIIALVATGLITTTNIVLAVIAVTTALVLGFSGIANLVIELVQTHE